ncbi:MAG: flagellar protein FliS [Deltaproteobacteria bacterium]|nr:flagellar protein FliS [Deltaproteobacteria bacterium]
MHRSAVAYKRVFVDSAPPARVLDELFGRLLADIEEARASIERRDIVTKARSINHALAILTELRAALDARTSEQLCAGLDRLYDFSAARIIAGSSELAVQPLDEATRVLAQLRDAFRLASEAK